ncbi:hypothetical protein GIB67_016315 [Kingdonia uniflora]|uniref:Uncharacterized protein n=1 Tax=Kingdonia uniflora TaxID=39325 RepID=A0A7J7M9E9_9MAGN|nr:hypothetical protein GIB67_016315 [Kingdonia uniflora]
MEWIVGSYDEGYVLQPEVYRQILSFNPGSIARTSKDIDTNQWTGTCVAYKASLDRFVDGCKPIHGLDGYFLKGKYGGVPNNDWLSPPLVRGSKKPRKVGIVDPDKAQSAQKNVSPIIPNISGRGGSVGRSANRARDRNGTGIYYNSYGSAIEIGIKLFGGGVAVSGRARGGRAGRNIGGTKGGGESGGGATVRGRASSGGITMRGGACGGGTTVRNGASGGGATVRSGASGGGITVRGGASGGSIIVRGGASSGGVTVRGGPSGGGVAVRGEARGG